jgi:formylglycine-generating enzyme required for sulfatase activity
MGENPSHFKGNKKPVECVSWDNAVEFCGRISKRTGKTYRLPSEAEWEYACRAGTTTPFHFGDTITSELVNYNGNYTYGSAPKGEYRRQTIDVGSFPANAFGLYDMHGNVWEWCQYNWHKNYQGAPNDGTAWIEDDNENNYRLLRGGSWLDVPGFCCCAYRNRNERDGRGNNIGFRVVFVSPRAS